MSTTPLKIAPLKVALIGCGDHARQQHAAPLSRWTAEHPGKITLVAACDPIQQRADDLCKQFGFAESFDDMRRMLDRVSPDACVSVPPVNLNASVGIELLNRRIPCVIEKPPGASMDEVNALAAVARRTGTPHMISMNRRFNPYLNRAADWFRSIGPLRQIIATMFRVDRREPEFIWATGIHAIDTVRYLGGEITTSTSRYDTSRSARRYLVDVEFSDGASGQIDIQPESNAVEESYELIGKSHRCEIRIDESGRTEAIGWLDGKIALAISCIANEPADIGCGAYGETDHFVNALLAGAPMKPTIDDVLSSAEIAFAMSTSL